MGNDWCAWEWAKEKFLSRPVIAPKIQIISSGFEALGAQSNREPGYIKLHKKQCCLGGRLNSPVAI